ncbi:MAG: transcriptional regulator, partial [Candidatus Marinimicrobia bacterium]|nr:transcriptional regulator [Candidatus Neomarinimicrobiota bacterium]
QIKDKLKNNILPSCMGLFDISLVSNNNKNIIELTLASGREKPYYIRRYGLSPKGCFIRVGSASEPMDVNQIEDMFSRRTRVSIGKIKSNKQDLSFEQLKIYYEEFNRTLNDQFASNLELLTEKGAFNLWCVFII